MTTSESPPLDFREVLRREFGERALRNPKYSQRAFARDLGLSSQHLSRLLKGGLGLSVSLATELADKMKLSKAESELFVALVEAQHSRTAGGRQNGQNKISKIQKQKQFTGMFIDNDEEFLRWYTLPTFVLFSFEEAKPSAHWVSERLQIPIHQARLAIDKLFREKLLAVAIDGRWVQTSKYFHVSSPSSTKAIRSFYSAVLEKAQLSINNIPPEERSISAGFIPLSKENFEKLRSLIDDFSMSAIRQFGEDTSNRKKIYLLSTQLFPVDSPSH